MNDDPTEAIRRQQIGEINAQPGSREALEAEHGQVWDTQELGRDFTVLGFMAPYVGREEEVGRAAGKPHVPTPAKVLLPLRAVPRVNQGDHHAHPH